MSFLSHDVIEPNRSIELSPLATIRPRGQICDAAKSASRALHVLEVLSAAGRPLRAFEMAKALKLSPSSADQVLKTMVDSAYLIFDPITKCYCLSPRIGKVGLQASEDFYEAKFLRKVMASIAKMAKTDVEDEHAVLAEAEIIATEDAPYIPSSANLSEMISIAASQGSYMQLVDVLRWTQLPVEGEVRPVELSIGTRIPMFGSCIGAAWLATQSDKTVRDTVDLCRRELKAQATDIDHILERIREIRKQGYAFGGVTPSASRAIALPLPPNRNGIVLVLSVSGRTHYMEQRREEIAAYLQETIRNASGKADAQGYVSSI
jgi:DNA-binding IclR family transcriptional regulator